MPKNQDVLNGVLNSYVDYYNLDVIISVSYRVKSKRGTQFRIWATGILKEYMRKGFALDYDPKAEISIVFFKKVQNKIHYAIHGQTAAEVIYNRADAEKELRAMGQLVSGYLDFAERQAEREQAMTMRNWAEHLDRILTMSGEQLLQGNGSISHKQAVDKASSNTINLDGNAAFIIHQHVVDLGSCNTVTTW